MDDPNSDPMGFGIYLDSWSSHYTIEDNTIYGGLAAGLFISNSDSNVVRNNTLYNNSLAPTGFSSQSEIQLQHICCNATAQNTVNSNVVFGIGTGKYLNFFYESSGTITGFGTLDSNYYVGASANSNQFSVQTGSISNQTFSGWKTSTGWDSHSTLSTLNSNAIDSLVFKYNATSSPITVPLGFKYIDAKGTSFNSGNITLQPYTSAVLIKNGALDGVAAPTANAGTDQTITLPTSSITLSGSGTVASGQTASYLWTKISGAGTQTITNNTTLTPTISGMTAAGDYVFQLKVTQTDTQFATSTVTSTVNDNIPPVPQAYDLWIRYNKTILINKQ
jgi:parallel beta-helix repeat protein